MIVGLEELQLHVTTSLLDFFHTVYNFDCLPICFSVIGDYI